MSRAKNVLTLFAGLTKVDVYMNPSPSKLRSLVSPPGIYRFIADDAKKAVYVWPAHQQIHGPVAIKLGIKLSLWGEVDSSGYVTSIFNDFNAEVKKWVGYDWTWTEKYGIKVEDYLKRRGYRK